jgi:hypothetical protein
MQRLFNGYVFELFEHAALWRNTDKYGYHIFYHIKDSYCDWHYSNDFECNGWHHYNSANCNFGRKQHPHRNTTSK